MSNDGPNGAAIKGPIPDLDLIAWQGREVTIVFDVNVRSNSNVTTARTKLAKELSDRGAAVRFVDLPEVDGVNGIDDLLGLWEREVGTEQALANGIELISAASLWTGRADVKTPKESQATSITKKFEGLDTYPTEDGKVYVDLPRRDHIETVSLDSQAFRDEVNRWQYRTSSRPASGRAIQDSIAALASIARMERPVRAIGMRSAREGDELYLDLTDKQWRQIRIGVNGSAIIGNDESPVRFRRSPGALDLPVDLETPSLDLLAEFVNVDPDGLILIKACILQYLLPNGPYPVLILIGEQGTAKSTAAKIIRSLVDPNLAPLRAFPLSPRELAISAEHSHLLVFANVSRISNQMSDALCQIATGGAFAARKLYSDGEEFVIRAAGRLSSMGSEALPKDRISWIAQ